MNYSKTYLFTILLFLCFCKADVNSADIAKFEKNQFASIHQRFMEEAELLGVRPIPVKGRKAAIINIAEVEEEATGESSEPTATTKPATDGPTGSGTTEIEEDTDSSAPSDTQPTASGTTAEPSGDADTGSSGSTTTDAPTASGTTEIDEPDSGTEGSGTTDEPSTNGTSTQPSTTKPTTSKPPPPTQTVPPTQPVPPTKPPFKPVEDNSKNITVKVAVELKVNLNASTSEIENYKTQNGITGTVSEEEEKKITKVIEDTKFTLYATGFKNALAIKMSTKDLTIFSSYLKLLWRNKKTEETREFRILADTAVDDWEVNATVDIPPTTNAIENIPELNKTIDTTDLSAQVNKEVETIINSNNKNLLNIKIDTGIKTTVNKTEKQEIENKVERNFILNVCGDCDSDNVTKVLEDFFPVNVNVTERERESESYISFIITVESNVTIAASVSQIIDDLLNESSDKHKKFYADLSKETGNENKCDFKAPECEYVINDYGRYSVGETRKTYSPTEKDETVTYMLNCSENGEKTHSITEDGNVTLSFTKDTTSFVTCYISCVNSHSTVQKSFHYQIYEWNRPNVTIEHTPTAIEDSDWKSTIKLVYPFPNNGKIDKKDMNVTITKQEPDNGFTLTSTIHEISQTTNFDVKGTFSREGDGTPLDVKQTTVTLNYTIHNMSFPFVVDVFPAECSGDATKDLDGYCCVKKHPDQLCRQVGATIHFETELTSHSIASFEKIYKNFISGTHFFYTGGSSTDNTISFYSAIYTQKVNTYRRLLSDDLLKQLENKLVKFHEATINKGDPIFSLFKDQGMTIDPTITFDVKVELSPKDVEDPIKDGDYKIVYPEPEKSWAEKYWYVILIIVLVVVILLIVLGVAIYYITLSNKASKAKKQSETFMDTVVPIEKVKTENRVEEKDIYIPYGNEIVMEGFLLKEGKNLLNKYQQRYFVLYYNPAIIRIYESMTPSYYGNIFVGEKQSIPLSALKAVDYDEGSSEFTLTFKVADSSLKSYVPGIREKVIHLKSENEDISNCKKWVESFRDYMNKKLKVQEKVLLPRAVMKDEVTGKFTTSTLAVSDEKSHELMNKLQNRRKKATTNPANVIRDA